MEKSIYNYMFDTSKKEEFLQDRKMKYYANKLEMTNGRFSEIMNGKRLCNKVIVVGICILCGHEDFENWFIKIK